MARPNHPTGQPHEPNSRDGDDEALIALTLASALVELLNGLSDMAAADTPAFAGAGIMMAAAIMIQSWRKKSGR